MLFNSSVNSNQISRRAMLGTAAAIRDFAAAVKAAGKAVELIEAPNYAHFEMRESLGNPYGPNGRAALN
jgi:hypothetical protein